MALMQGRVTSAFDGRHAIDRRPFMPLIQAIAQNRINERDGGFQS